MPAPQRSLAVAPEELAAVEMLAALPAEPLAELAATARPRLFSPAEVIIREGDVGDSLHIVRSGQVKVVRPSRDASLVLQTLGPGQVFGELAVLNSANRLATVVAVEETETIEVGKKDLDAVLDRNPHAMRGMLGTLAVSLTLAKEQLARHNQVLEQRVRERTREIHETHLETIRRLGQAAESRDDDTGLHITRMSRLAHRLALAAGVGEEQAQMLLHASPMHDIGKIGIPDRILLKQGVLDPEEWEVMKTHTSIGAKILAGSNSRVVQMAEKIALYHHERWDGTGYPEGLAGEEIPLVARICAICDVFDALSSDRPYKGAWMIEEAREEIRRGSGTHFDPRLVEIFLGRFDELNAGLEPNGKPASNGRAHKVDEASSCEQPAARAALR
jgi:HD-GYP domain-containing protein (c-di-GMP phosphodiesterase class II)